MLRGIFGPKRDEGTGEWRKLHNEERNGLYCSPYIVRVIKIEDNEMGESCSTYGGEERHGRHLRERDHLGDLDVGGRIILR